MAKILNTKLPVMSQFSGCFTLKVAQNINYVQYITLFNYFQIIYIHNMIYTKKTDKSSSFLVFAKDFEIVSIFFRQLHIADDGHYVDSCANFMMPELAVFSVSHK